MMRVKATQKGYYDLRQIDEGEVFELKKSEHYSERWMEKCDRQRPEPEVSEVDAPEEPAKVQKEASQKGRRRLTQETKPLV